MSTYPSAERQSCGYAIRYIKWLVESETTVEAGPDAFALLTAVAIAEDRLHYSRPPNFYNEQICRHSGIGSLPALIRARNRAIDLGLLHYSPAAKRRPGTYFVCGFPNDSLRKAEGIRKESGRNPTPSIPLPLPVPKKIREVASLDPAFQTFWEAYPLRNGKRVGKADAVKAFAKIKPTDRGDLMLAVKSYAATCGDFAKDPVRFLRNDFWRDHLVSPELPTTTKKLTPMTPGRRKP